MVPLPDEANVSLSGLARARFTSSATEFTGRPGRTASRFCPDVKRPMTWRSRSMSYGRFDMRLGKIERYTMLA